MLYEAVTNQWFWLGAAGFFIVLLGLLVGYNVRRSQNGGAKIGDGGWIPTGRIDFAGPDNPDPEVGAAFLLQAEDTRIVNSVGGVDHHEVRWRRATLNEAKRVVLAYNGQLKRLAPTSPTTPAANKRADPESPPPPEGVKEDHPKAE
jgi:hypothetical protein